MTNGRKNLILQEQAASKQYMLESFCSDVTNQELIKLTPDNVARAEAMFHTDSAYSVSADTKNEKSSAFSIMRLKELIDSGNCKGAQYRKIITEIVERLDVENSTHLNSDGVSRSVIVKRIVAIDVDTLMDYLEHPEETHFKLMDIIAKKTKPVDDRHKGRTNKSFASKFCHYLCFFMFQGEEFQDNYPIYDSVIKKNLPKYLKHYELGRRDLDNYKSYRQAIDDVVAASGEKISRNGFDHLVWYSYK